MFEGQFGREQVGDTAERAGAAFLPLAAQSLGAALHLTVRGENTHHMIEACFKGVGPRAAAGASARRQRAAEHQGRAVSDGCDVAIIDSGGANWPRCSYALERLGARSIVSSRPAVIAAAPRVLLPGSRRRRRRHGAAARQRAGPAHSRGCGPPLLGICLGMQLLFEHSAEGDTRCLGVLPRPRRTPAGGAGAAGAAHGLEHAATSAPLTRCSRGIGRRRLRSISCTATRAGRRRPPLATARYGALHALRAWRNFRGVQFHPERSAARRRAHAAQFPGAAARTVLLIPSIDLRGGHCVRLLRGDFAAETRYQPRRRNCWRDYRQLGARWLHVVDLDGARDGTLGNRA